MIKDIHLTTEKDDIGEEYYARLETYRKLNPRNSDEAIRKHLIRVLNENFMWDFWITFTFGYKPDLDVVEDILFKLHHRIDKRILKHHPDTSIMRREDRSDWILFPELGGRGLHYHGFIKLNLRPNLGHSYETEWWWMKTAFDNTIGKLDHYLPNDKIGYKIYDRSRRYLDNLKMVIYSMKEFCDLPNEFSRNRFDRIAHTIISRDCWKPTPIHKHRGSNKIDGVPDRPNKTDIGGLSGFFEKGGK